VGLQVESGREALVGEAQFMPVKDNDALRRRRAPMAGPGVTVILDELSVSSCGIQAAANDGGWQKSKP
jgi:hypothetical protein